jgi:hypothetical protein
MGGSWPIGPGQWALHVTFSCTYYSEAQLPGSSVVLRSVRHSGVLKRPRGS